MFESYSIATASRHPSSLPCRDDYGSIQTTIMSDTSSLGLRRKFSRQLSISQLTQRFGAQQIYQDDAQAVSPSSQPFDPMSAESFGVRLPVGLYTPSNRRVRRQEGVRMLCDPSHLRNIQDMVAKMVESGDQCDVSISRTFSQECESPTLSTEDEGYSSFEDNVCRRDSTASNSSTFKKTIESPVASTYVSKQTRVRKSYKRRSTGRSI